MLRVRSKDLVRVDHDDHDGSRTIRDSQARVSARFASPAVCDTPLLDRASVCNVGALGRNPSSFFPNVVDDNS